MPDYLPAHSELVAVSGVAEILSGAGRHPPAHKEAGRRAGISTLARGVPANLHMALHPERYRRSLRRALRRLPIQALMIYWVWLATFG